MIINCYGINIITKNLGIIGEPNFDIDWDEFAYFTDTGRRWNSSNINVRDKVKSKYNFDFKMTRDLIVNVDKIPFKNMFTVHPHRWFNGGIMWSRELIFQNLKNSIKYFIVKKNKYKEKIYFQKSGNSKVFYKI